ncbi:hypothetical protein P5673_015451 [Acropora cervicornis]|uniref:Uncharacterized protein n=1 Tax=Acropora cervicornis TaxID=6130 RepID=A0AAD9V510_ACRCE|nr:hypothetical protein P5673_015451 [Acropora cervicornis]
MALVQLGNLRGLELPCSDQPSKIEQSQTRVMPDSLPSKAGFKGIKFCTCHLPQGYFKHLLVASRKHPQTIIINEKGRGVV